MTMTLPKSYHTEIWGSDGYIIFSQMPFGENKEEHIALTKIQFVELIKNAENLLEEADAEDEE